MTVYTLIKVFLLKSWNFDVSFASTRRSTVKRIRLWLCAISIMEDQLGDAEGVFCGKNVRNGGRKIWNIPQNVLTRDRIIVHTTTKWWSRFLWNRFLNIISLTFARSHKHTHTYTYTKKYLRNFWYLCYFLLCFLSSANKVQREAGETPDIVSIVGKYLDKFI